MSTGAMRFLALFQDARSSCVARPGTRYRPDTAAHQRYRTCVDACAAVPGGLGGAWAALGGVGADP